MVAPWRRAGRARSNLGSSGLGSVEIYMKCVSNRRGEVPLAPCIGKRNEWIGEPNPYEGLCVCVALLIVALR